jgi:glutamate synthase (ferredoxin)
VQGNVNWMASRQDELTHPVWGGRESDLLPICRPGNSDSAHLDNTAELLVRTGEPIDKSLMVLVPEAYDNHPELDEKYPHVKDFYRCALALQLLFLTLHNAMPGM